MDKLEQLIQSCCEGKASAQRAIFERYSPYMLNVCLHYFQQLNEAEEVMLKGFYTIFSKIDTYTAQGHFEAWMRRIMVNTAIDHFRKKRTNGKIHFFDDLPDFASPSVPADKSLEHKDILALVHQLPTGYRMVFILFVIEGYSHAEIAEKFGISESTSKTQLMKARKFLQRIINNLQLQA
ncbi:MAG: RNA polymerase sigma factor [Bacteroidales bacterium]|nr:RNA polymerase sigma factor [Bacteroidales bacterium]